MIEKKEIENVLKEFEKIKEIVGSAIVRTDGVLIATSLPNKVDSKAVAAMTAAVVGTGETATQELDIGKFEHAVVNASGGKYVCIKAGDEGILISLLKKDIKIESILPELKRKAEKIGNLLKEIKFSEAS
jgi:predicted regulator of Ras-like GTPase activity (Roadblock/LC7/MglB family)